MYMRVAFCQTACTLTSTMLLDSCMQAVAAACPKAWCGKRFAELLQEGRKAKAHTLQAFTTVLGIVSQTCGRVVQTKHLPVQDQCGQAC